MIGEPELRADLFDGAAAIGAVFPREGRSAARGDHRAAADHFEQQPRLLARIGTRVFAHIGTANRQTVLPFAAERADVERVVHFVMRIIGVLPRVYEFAVDVQRIVRIRTDAQLRSGFGGTVKILYEIGVLIDAGSPTAIPIGSA